MKFAIFFALVAVASARSIRMMAFKDIPMALWKKVNTDGDNVLSEAEHTAFYVSMDADKNMQLTVDEWNKGCMSFTGQDSAACGFVFSKTDMNNDGVIDRVDGVLQQQAMDKNGDGKVDMKEFVGTWAMLMKHVMIAGLFMKADKDMDGSISPADLAAVFASFDADGDSSVSKGEFVNLWTSAGFGDAAQAAKMFMMADSDKSGALDASDMTAMFAGFDADSNGAVSQDEFMMKFLSLGAPSKPTRSVRKMTDKDIPMMLWKKVNTDGDNILSEAEHTAFYVSMDADNNMQLSRDEWNAGCMSFTGRDAADCGIVFDMTDMNDDGVIDRADGVLQQQFMDKNGDGQVDMKEFVGTWGMLMKQAPLVGLFMKADKDMDGSISPADLAAVFASFDADGDSAVSAAEFVGLWTSQGLGDAKKAKMFFMMADSDKSGALDASDMTAMFAGFDADSDGAVSKEEFMKKFMSLGQKPPMGKPGN